jgi:hypothetical protein
VIRCEESKTGSSVRNRWFPGSWVSEDPAGAALTDASGDESPVAARGVSSLEAVHAVKIPATITSVAENMLAFDRVTMVRPPSEMADERFSS